MAFSEYLNFTKTYTSVETKLRLITICQGSSFYQKANNLFSAWMQLHTKEENTDKNQVASFTVTCYVYATTHR
jgi:hypothetical protein